MWHFYVSNYYINAGKFSFDHQFLNTYSRNRENYTNLVLFFHKLEKTLFRYSVFVVSTKYSIIFGNFSEGFYFVVNYLDITYSTLHIITLNYFHESCGGSRTTSWLSHMTLSHTCVDVIATTSVLSLVLSHMTMKIAK